MSGYALTIRTGDPELDRQKVDEQRRHAEAGGMTLVVEPLPGGGFSVRAEAAVSSTLPSNVAEFRPSQAPPGAPSPLDSLPQPVMGTMPSRLGRARPSQAPAVVMATPGGICQSCGRSGPTKLVRFSQVQGAVVLLFRRSVHGYLCKLCIDDLFFRMTGTTLLLGFLGIPAGLFALVAIPRNVIAWASSVGMAGPPEDFASVTQRRARSTVQIGVGVLVSLLAAGFTTAGLYVVADGRDEQAGVEAAAFGLSLAVLSLVVIGVGVRGRLKAATIERRLGGSLTG